MVIVLAGSFAMAALGCNLAQGLLGAGPGLVQGGRPGEKQGEMTIKGTALFPAADDPRKFAALPGTAVEILDIKTGAVLKKGSADAAGKFAIKVAVQGRPEDTVVAVKARAKRGAAAYRISAEVELQVSGLAGLLEATVDPATTIAAAKVIERAKASGDTVKIDLTQFRTLVQKIATALTPELITTVTSGGTSAAAAFDSLAAKDATLAAAAAAALSNATSQPAASPTAMPSASPVPTPTPGGGGPTATPAPSPGATQSPSPGATPTPTPGATPTPSPGATPTPSPGATPTPG
ncbi:MAG: hypothetical protein FJZ01_14785, partial [Candidatus Sericytochromatia bacterium]|nr:hypothetical protein [Candidatus Tanganyikabacteria bacterium]